MTDKLSYSVDEAMAALGIGRNAFYKAVSSGELATFSVGKRRLVSRRALEEFVQKREQAASPFARTPRTGGRHRTGPISGIEARARALRASRLAGEGGAS